MFIDFTRITFLLIAHIRLQIDNDDIATIEEAVQKIVRPKIERIEAPKSGVNELFAYNPLKLRMIDAITNDRIPLYRCGYFIDLSFTPIMRHNKKAQSIKILKVRIIEPIMSENFM